MMNQIFFVSQLYIIHLEKLELLKKIGANKEIYNCMSIYESINVKYSDEGKMEKFIIIYIQKV